MNVRRGNIAVKDNRGEIVDILQGTPFEHATLISTKAGARRGDHYHRETTQYVYVLSGVLQAESRVEGELKDTQFLYPGDLWTTEPNERHALIAVMDSRFLVLTHGPRGGTNYESDTFREAV